MTEASTELNFSDSENKIQNTTKKWSHLKLELFVLLILVNVVYDLCSQKTSTCIDKKSNMFFVIIAHHIFCVFLYFGWIFDNCIVNFVYISTVLFTLVYWIINGFCHWTRYTNSECEWQEGEKFNELLNLVNKKTNSSVKVHYYIMTLGIIMGFWKFIGHHCVSSLEKITL
jgi:hypothetical protein